MTTDRRTNRWRGITAMALFGVAAGVALEGPGLLVAGAVSVGYAAYAAGASAPAVEVTVERDLSDERPQPGEEVEVETTVHNVGDAALPDLRVVDGVPEGLAVVDGSPRTYTALAPGGRATITYTVEAARGEHQFRPPRLFARDPSGAVERETTAADEGAVLTCVPRDSAGESVSLRPVTRPYTGAVTSDAGGPGVEFHSLREYRPGDALGRVAWRHLARTGELATVDFNAERMASVLLVVDARPAAYTTTPTDEPTAVEHGLAAARGLLDGLLSEGNQVGAASLGPEPTYLEPGLGRSHRVRAREFLATGVPTTRPAGEFFPEHLDELRRRIEGTHQVIWLSPLLDDYAVSVARTLAIDGHAVTTVTPDVTTDGSPGELLVRAERNLRLSSLRDADVRVVDWRPGEPLPAAIAAAERGWTA